MPAVTDDDWPIDSMLTTSRGKIYATIPSDWTFVGPIRRRDGSWTVGVRATTGADPIEGSGATLPDAFRTLAARIREAGIKPGPQN